MLSYAEALARLKRQSAPDVDPVLSDSDLADILDDASGVQRWTPNTAYGYGNLLLPVTPMGRLYRCTLSGVSDVTEPFWLGAPSWTPAPRLFMSWLWGGTVSPFLASPWLFGLKDGTAAFCDWSPFGGELYDVRRATREAWLLKAQRASSRTDMSMSGVSSVREGEIYKNCMSQAQRYAPLGFI